MDNLSKFNKIMSKVLNLPVKAINDELSPQNTESWDSFNALMLITEFEKVFGMEFSLDEVSKVKNAGDIKKVLRKHGVKI